MFVTPSVIVKGASQAARRVTLHSVSPASTLFDLLCLAQCDGRKEWESAQSICVEDACEYDFHSTVQFDEDVLNFFNLQCFPTRTGTKRIT